MIRIAAITTLRMLGAALGMQATALPAQTEPLAPVGKWKVEYAEHMCVLSHVFGTGASQVILGFRPWPMGLTTEVVLMSSDSSGPASSFGKGTRSLSPTG